MGLAGNSWVAARTPRPSSLARRPYGWAQVATFVVTGLLIVILAVAVRGQLHVVLLALLVGWRESRNWVHVGHMLVKSTTATSAGVRRR